MINYDKIKYDIKCSGVHTLLQIIIKQTYNDTDILRVIKKAVTREVKALESGKPIKRELSPHNLYMRSYMRKIRNYQPHQKECAHCGKSFVSKRSDAKYCKASCRVMANR